MANETEEFERALQAARKRAHLNGHAYVGTEDLLLGVLQQGSSMVAGVLASFGITYQVVVARHAFIFGKSPGARPVFLDPPGITLTVVEGAPSTYTPASPTSEFTPSAAHALERARAIAGENRTVRLSYLMAALLNEHSVGKGLLEITINAERLPSDTLSRIAGAVGRLVSETEDQ